MPTPDRAYTTFDTPVRRLASPTRPHRLPADLDVDDATWGLAARPLGLGTRCRAAALLAEPSATSSRLGPYGGPST
jgi:hypothetical protein